MKYVFEKSRNVNISFEALLLMRKCKHKVFELYLLSEKCYIGHTAQWPEPEENHNSLLLQVKKLISFQKILYTKFFQCFRQGCKTEITKGRREKLLNLEYLNKRRRLSKLLLDYIKRICIFTSWKMVPLAKNCLTALFFAKSFSFLSKKLLVVSVVPKSVLGLIINS